MRLRRRLRLITTAGATDALSHREGFGRVRDRGGGGDGGGSLCAVLRLLRRLLLLLLLLA